MLTLFASTLLKLPSTFLSTTPPTYSRDCSLSSLRSSRYEFAPSVPYGLQHELSVRIVPPVFDPIQRSSACGAPEIT
uniref:Putative secreted peptide n=1 Tax=Anopheles braziliensis TaxID=58242 RepID=A0A2M3ZWB7_9DIPT